MIIIILELIFQLDLSKIPKWNCFTLGGRKGGNRGRCCGTEWTVKFYPNSSCRPTTLYFMLIPPWSYRISGNTYYFCVYYICKNLDGTKRGEDLTKLLPLPHLKGQPIAFDYEYNKIKVILFFFFFLLLHFWLPKSCKIVWVWMIGNSCKSLNKNHTLKTIFFSIVCDSILIF